MASLKDIAKSVGVSVSTVSYALNGGPKPVEKRLREKILAVAAEMDYRPNNVAKAMVTGRSRTVGIVPGHFGPEMLSYPFIQSAMTGLAKTAIEVQHDLLLYSHSADISEHELQLALMDRRADGFVMITPVGRESIIQRLVQKGAPIVLLSGHPGFGAPVFACDNEGGMGQAIRYLRSLGHTEIAHLHGNLQMNDGAERLSGFRRYMQEYDLKVQENWILDGEFTAEGGYRAFRKLAADGPLPTAIVCANDDSAGGVFQAARDLGLSIPDSISVVGFDDSPMGSYIHPQLTTVRQPIEAIAGEALRCLIQMIEEKPAPQMVRFPTDLVIRASTAPPAGQKGKKGGGRA